MSRTMVVLALPWTSKPDWAGWPSVGIMEWKINIESEQMANMISLWLEGEGLVDAGDAGEDALIPKKQAYDG